MVAALGWCAGIQPATAQYTLLHNFVGAPDDGTVFALALSTQTVTVTLLSNDPALTYPYGLTTDGTHLFVGNSNSILSLPIGGGAVTMLYSNCTPSDPVADMTSIGTNLFWIDPNGDPDATAIFSAPTSGGTITKIYSGFATGEPIVDGASITTDGIKLYTADEVQGMIVSLNPDGSDITLLGARYGGFFDLEHYNAIAESGGILYVADDGAMAMSGIPPQVVSIPTNGGTFTTLYSGTPFVHLQGIAVGGGMVYVADPGADNTIWQLPISGGTPTVLVSGAPFVSIARLLFFNDALYITDTGHAGATNGPGAIYKIDHLPPPPPPAPTGVSASDGTYTNKVRVSWVTSSGATSYEVWRYTNDNSSAAEKISSPDATETSYDDTNATAGITYYYWVKSKSVNAAGASSFSASDSGFLGVVGPLITANGLVGDVYLSSEDTVTITVAMNTGDYAGIPVDWWVIVCAGSSWYYMNNSYQWTPLDGNFHPVYQGLLSNLPETEVLNIGLDSGSYTFYFAVDYPMDGILDINGTILVDAVNVTVQ